MPKAHTSDFKHRKVKVGQKKLAPANELRLSLKVATLEGTVQRPQDDEESLSAAARVSVSVKEAVQHCRHHNESMRREAVVALRELAKDPDVLEAHTAAIVTALSERILDDEPGIRSVLLPVLCGVVALLPPSSLPTLLPLLTVYVTSAMTKLHTTQRLDALTIASELLHVAPHATVHLLSPLLPCVCSLLEPALHSMVTPSLIHHITPPALALGSASTAAAAAASTAAAAANGGGGSMSGGAGGAASSAGGSGSGGGGVLKRRKLDAIEARLAVVFCLRRLLLGGRDAHAGQLQDVRAAAAAATAQTGAGSASGGSSSGSGSGSSSAIDTDFVVPSTTLTGGAVNDAVTAESIWRPRWPDAGFSPADDDDEEDDEEEGEGGDDGEAAQAGTALQLHHTAGGATVYTEPEDAWTANTVLELLSAAPGSAPTAILRGSAGDGTAVGASPSAGGVTAGAYQLSAQLPLHAAAETMGYLFQIWLDCGAAEAHAAPAHALHRLAVVVHTLRLVIQCSPQLQCAMREGHMMAAWVNSASDVAEGALLRTLLQESRLPATASSATSGGGGGGGGGGGAGADGKAPALARMCLRLILLHVLPRFPIVHSGLEKGAADSWALALLNLRLAELASAVLPCPAAVAQTREAVQLAVTFGGVELKHSGKGASDDDWAKGGAAGNQFALLAPVPSPGARTATAAAAAAAASPAPTSSRGSKQHKHTAPPPPPSLPPAAELVKGKGGGKGKGGRKRTYADLMSSALPPEEQAEAEEQQQQQQVLHSAGAAAFGQAGAFFGQPVTVAVWPYSSSSGGGGAESLWQASAASATATAHLLNGQQQLQQQQVPTTMSAGAAATRARKVVASVGALEKALKSYTAVCRGVTEYVSEQLDAAGSASNTAAAALPLSTATAVALLPCFLPLLTTLLPHASETDGAQLVDAFSRMYGGCAPRCRLKARCVAFIVDCVRRYSGPTTTSTTSGGRQTQPLYTQQYELAEATLIGWIQSFPRLLWSLGSSDVATSRRAVRLLLALAKAAPRLSPLHLALREAVKQMTPLFYTVKTAASGTELVYGPFLSFPHSLQRDLLSLPCFTGGLTAPLKRALAVLARCMQLPPHTRSRIIEVAVQTALTGEGDGLLADSDGDGSRLPAAAAEAVAWLLCVVLGRQVDVSTLASGPQLLIQAPSDAYAGLSLASAPASTAGGVLSLSLLCSTSAASSGASVVAQADAAYQHTLETVIEQLRYVAGSLCARTDAAPQALAQQLATALAQALELPQPQAAEAAVLSRSLQLTPRDAAAVIVMALSCDGVLALCAQEQRAWVAAALVARLLQAQGAAGGATAAAAAPAALTMAQSVSSPYESPSAFASLLASLNSTASSAAATGGGVGAATTSGGSSGDARALAVDAPAALLLPQVIQLTRAHTATVSAAAYSLLRHHSLLLEAAVTDGAAVLAQLHAGLTDGSGSGSGSGAGAAPTLVSLATTAVQLVHTLATRAKPGPSAASAASAEGSAAPLPLPLHSLTHIATTCEAISEAVSKGTAGSAVPHMLLTGAMAAARAVRLLL